MSFWKISKFTASSLIGSLGIISALVSIFWPETRQVSIWIINLTALIFLWVFIILLMLYSDLTAENEKLKSKAQRLYEIPFDVRDREGDMQDLLIHENPIFKNQSIVCVFYVQNSYEDPAFIGEIINHQTDGKMQVQLSYKFPGYENKKLAKNELGNIIIKSNIPIGFVKVIQES